MGFKSRNVLTPLASTILGQLERGPKSRGQITAHLRTVGGASRASVRTGIGELLSVKLVDREGQRRTARFSLKSDD